MEKLWRRNVRDIDPYVPGEQSKEQNIVKINANENPYPPSPQVQKAINDFNCGKLRFYPDANATDFKTAVAEFYELEAENVFLGNGSDDVLALAFQAFFNSDLPIAFPDITYSFYPVWCRLFEIPFKTFPLGSDFRINPEDYRAESGGVVIPNPNAPTSLGEGKAFIEKLMDYNRDCIVIIDEAYVDFGGYSSAELVKKYDNLLVTGSFSKSRSLAGMRIGYALGSKELIGILEAVKNSYNSYTVSSIAMAAGTAAIKDKEYFYTTVAKVITTRERVKTELEALGFEVLDSQTNFLFATHGKYSMRDYFEWLKGQKVFIRYFNLPRIDNYVRITVGTNEEMDIFLAKTREYIDFINTK